jgi:hypothetical protein
MKSPVCSAVFLASGGVEQLAVSLDAAVLQLDGDIEAIAVDDGSSSAASVWLAQRRRELPALRIVEIEGAGAAQARNAAIEAARAPLIAFIESGDWWWPGKIAAQAAYHEAHPETALSFTDYLLVTADGESLGSCFEYWQPALRQRRKAGYFRLDGALPALIAMNLAGTSTVAATKAALEKAGGFRSLDAAEDWDLWLRLAGEAPAACSKAVTATCLLRTPSPAQQRARVAAMEQIVSPYEESSAASVRNAAAKARARLDAVCAELARPAGLCAPRSRYRPQAFMTTPPAQPGKRTPAGFLNEALYFVGPC